MVPRIVGNIREKSGKILPNLANSDPFLRPPDSFGHVQNCREVSRMDPELRKFGSNSGVFGTLFGWYSVVFGFIREGIRLYSCAFFNSAKNLEPKCHRNDTKLQPNSPEYTRIPFIRHKSGLFRSNSVQFGLIVGTIRETFWTIRPFVGFNSARFWTIREYSGGGNSAVIRVLF